MNAAAGGAKAIEGMPPAEGKSVLWLPVDSSGRRGDRSWWYGWAISAINRNRDSLPRTRFWINHPMFSYSSVFTNSTIILCMHLKTALSRNWKLKHNSRHNTTPGYFNYFRPFNIIIISPSDLSAYFFAVITRSLKWLFVKWFLQ
jgi:hypothetical protein